MSGQKKQLLRITSFFKQNFTFAVLVPMIVAVHTGWFVYQRRYIPEEERHDHLLTKLYKKYIT